MPKNHRMTASSNNLTATGKIRLMTMSGLDQRTIAARRAKSQIEALEEDLGGRENLNVREQMLVRDVAFLDTYIEDCASRYIAGEPICVSDWTIAIGARRRILAMFGLQGGPAPDDVTPPAKAEDAAIAAQHAVQRAVENVISERGEPVE